MDLKHHTHDYEPTGPPADAGVSLLTVSGVYKYYREFLAVNGVSFNVERGATVGLVGPNGAGKTTILRCIAGIIRPTYGGITVAGDDMIADPQQAKHGVSLVPETPNLYDLLTVTEHLRFIHMAFSEQTDFQPLADSLLERLELTEKRHELVGSLSKGMRQKVAIACAFMHSSQILLFDEPFIGIDPSGQRAVREMIREASSHGKAVLISSHILETVEHLCERLLVLNRGQLIAEGTLAQLRQGAGIEDGVSLEDVFLTLTRESRAV